MFLRFLLSFCLGIIFCVTQAQRPYNNQSVLSTGTIYKLGIVKNGIYQLNESFFQQIGLAYPIKTGSVTLFGNGSFLPTEKVTNEGYLDDVQTIPMHWADGGDGQLDRGDYCVFYGDFSQQPTFDNNQYHFSENLYADTVYYFLKLNTFNNAFIPKQAFIPSANKQTNLYDEVILYENDWVNLLNSGKEWYGEEWNMRTANATERSFNFTSLTPAIGATHSIQSFFAVRSVAQPAVLTCKLNGNTIATQTVQAGSGGFLDVFAEKVNITASTVNNNNNWQLSIGFQSNNNNAQAWLDKLILTVKSTLQLSNGKSLFFRNSEVIEQQTATTYSLQNGSADWQIWDITKPSNPVIINTGINNNFLRFTDSSNSLKQYVAFEKGSVLTPTILGKMNNQNLHAISNEVDYFIVTHESLLPAANELANFHTQILQHKVQVVTTASIGNEFGSGICTPIGLRNFIKMLYDRRQQNQLKTSLTVCLLGAASFDYKKRIINNTSLVPCFETEESLSPLKSYTSDDFFTFLNDGDDINNYQQQPKMSIAVGRIPAAKLADAYKMVDKIKAYHQKLSVGNWRNKAVFIADDKDLNLHLTDAEWLAQQASETNSLINISKLYADAFPLVVTNNSPKFPVLTQQFIQSFNNGSLFINYTGHGGFQQLADEGIFTFNELPLLNNANKLPLVITATCDFAPFDDPTKQSLGNELLLKNNNGAIALLTTTRTVFAYSNRIMNEALLKALLSKSTANNQYLTLGQALMQAKNNLYSQFSDVYNNRKFTLLGDPGIQLAFPPNKLQIDSVVEVPSLQKTKQINPQKQYAVHGTVINAAGNRAANFNGLLEAQIWPYTTTQSTLGNSPESPVKLFATFQQTMFNGKASINNGQFQFNFYTPADLKGNLTKGRISLYAINSADSTDAGGADTTFLFGGNANSNIDNSPPQIDLFINHFGFVSGGVANNEPILLARIKDDFGINTLGLANDKPMMVWLDDKKDNFFIVNNYYTTNVNDFTSGILQFQLPALSEGMHSVTLKVWDANNNPAEKTIFFQVKAAGSVAIFSTTCFPNPVVQSAQFGFEHNQPMGISMKINLIIYDFAGRIIKKTTEDITVKSSVISNLKWDGTGMNNEKIPSGVYIYRIIVQTKNGSAESTGKLLLR